MPYPFSVIDKINFSPIAVTDFPFFDFFPFSLFLSLSIIDNETISSFDANSIPFIPLEDLPLNILSFFASLYLFAT